MSRHEIRRDGMVVIVGWDNPLETFFAQVWAERDFDGDGDAAPLLWVGCFRAELPDIAALRRALARYGDLPGDVVAGLVRDREGREPPTALQRLLST